MVTGERKIEPAESAVVQQILRNVAAGQSTKQPATMLNHEGVAGPLGGKVEPEYRA
jgi:hypothetical protein